MLFASSSVVKDFFISHFFYRYDKMKIGGDYFDGAETKLPRACHVLVKWISNEIRPCKILHFIEKTIEVTTISGELQLQTYSCRPSYLQKLFGFRSIQRRPFSQNLLNAGASQYMKMKVNIHICQLIESKTGLFPYKARFHW